MYCFKDEVRKSTQLLDENPAIIGKYEFKAYGYVPDYPFSLKTACKLDEPGWSLKEDYIGPPVDVTKEGYVYPIDDIKKYFNNKGTIQEDLDNFPCSSNTIMAFHCPPDRLDLDVCGINRGNDLWVPKKKVGSRSIYNWIEKHQPNLVLCGHIHESYAVTKKWKAMIGETTVIQPGQLPDQTTMVVIELDESIRCELI